MTCRWGYPKPRDDRGGPFPPAVTERFPGYESTDGEVVLADTLADVFVCSGQADAFVISARLFGALVQITDRARRETHEITIPVGTSDTYRIPGDVVRARNLIAGSNASVSVTALYAYEGRAE